MEEEWKDYRKVAKVGSGDCLGRMDGVRPRHCWQMLSDRHKDKPARTKVNHQEQQPEVKEYGKSMEYGKFANRKINDLEGGGYKGCEIHVPAEGCL